MLMVSSSSYVMWDSWSSSERLSMATSRTQTNVPNMYQGRGRGVSKRAARTDVRYMELTRICTLFGITYGINMVCYTCWHDMAMAVTIIIIYTDHYLPKSSWPLSSASSSSYCGSRLLRWLLASGATWVVLYLDWQLGLVDTALVWGGKVCTTADTISGISAAVNGRIFSCFARGLSVETGCPLFLFLAVIVGQVSELWGRVDCSPLGVLFAPFFPLLFLRWVSLAFSFDGITPHRSALKLFTPRSENSVTCYIAHVLAFLPMPTCCSRSVIHDTCWWLPSTLTLTLSKGI